MVDAKDIARLRRLVYLRLPVAVAALLAVWLGAAGTPRYWQAWLVACTFFVLLLAVGTFFMARDPEFLLRRVQFREKEMAQRKVMRIWSLLTIGAMVLPALDVRFGWSKVPVWLCLAGYVLMLAAYGFVLWVFRTNRYASRIVEVQPGQTVVSTGPYAVVRHPMYSSQLVMLPALMVALGSWWTAALSLLIIMPLVLRIRNEEDVLRRDLAGYVDYCERVRYRLVPGVW
jgi:protein-S-isoprenylcysteine O-methyltransferase Ste14